MMRCLPVCFAAALCLLITWPSDAQTSGPLGKTGEWTKGSGQGFVEYLTNNGADWISVNCDVAYSPDHSGSGISVGIGSRLMPRKAPLVFEVDGSEVSVQSDRAGGLSVRQCPECTKSFRDLLTLMKAGERLTVKTADGHSAVFTMAGFAEVMDEPCLTPTVSEPDSPVAPNKDKTASRPAEESLIGKWVKHHRDGSGTTANFRADPARPGHFLAEIMTGNARGCAGFVEVSGQLDDVAVATGQTQYEGAPICRIEFRLIGPDRLHISEEGNCLSFHGATCRFTAELTRQGVLPPEAGSGPAAIRQAQQLLVQLGYDAGPIDGVMGRKTKSAIAAFQRDAGLPVTGQPDDQLLSALQSAPPGIPSGEGQRPAAPSNTPLTAVRSAHEPPRGSRERAAILDAIRPKAATYLGPPVEFVVDELRVSDDQAFAMLDAQRPGGARIDMRDTPWGRGPHYSPPIDSPRIIALLRRRGGQWVVVEDVFSPTDASFANAEHCREWRVVLPKVWCQ